jgi:uncharacterized membrane protein
VKLTTKVRLRKRPPRWTEPAAVGIVMVINGSDTRGRMRHASAGMRVTCALLAGAVIGAVASLFTVPSASILLGWDAAVAIYLAWTWGAVWRLDHGLTARLAKREDPSVAVAELLLIGAGVAALAAVAFALVKAGQAADGMKAFLIALGLFSVVLSWILVHTVYGLRYARAYYSEPAGGIEFNEDEPPTYIDFAYFAFTIGMTFQVSDTNITSKPVRRITLRHALLSYLFGTVLLGLVINVVATLLK